MLSLLSGSTLRAGGSGDFINLSGAQPQLPATDTTLTGFTLVTDSLLRTTYRSSLGFIEFTSATMYSALPTGTIKIINTGSNAVSTGTTTGLLVVQGDIGVGGTVNIGKDITVNGITIGQGYQGINNIVVRGKSTAQVNSYENGQESIAIGYDTLLGIATSYKNLAIGRYALSSGTNISNNIAIGDSALKIVGVFTSTGTLNDSNVAIGINSGVKLINGQQNLFLGHESANELTTGSYNIIIGPLTGQYLYTGSGIISIGGDNIVDGKDDQVNIGSVFYYDGSGYAYISAETTVGLGTRAAIISTGTFTSASTVTGGLVVVGGIFGWDNLILKDTFTIYGTGTSTIAGPLVPSTANVTLGTESNPFASLYLSGTTLYLSTVTLKSYDSQNFAIESPAGYVTQTVGNLHLTSGFNSTGYNNGSLLVDGGIGVSGNVNINGKLNVKGTQQVDISPVGESVYLKPLGSGRVEIRPASTGYMDNMIIGLYDPSLGRFDNIQVLNVTSSTSPTTGALTVAGGVGIGGDLYVGGNIIASGTDSSITFNTVTIDGGNTAHNTTSGDLVVAGGVGIQGDVYIGGALTIAGITYLTTASFNVDISEGTDIDIRIDPLNSNLVSFYNISTLQSVTSRGNSTSEQLSFLNVTESTSTVTGSVVIAGGLGVAKRINAESVGITDVVLDSRTTQVNTTASTVIDSFGIIEFRSAKYLIQIDEGTGTSADFELREILLVADNNQNVWATEYGLVTSGNELGTFSAEVSSNIVNLYFTAYNDTYKIVKLLRTGIKTN